MPDETLATSDLIQPLYSVYEDIEAQRWEVTFLVH